MQHEEVDDYYPIALQIFDFGNLAQAGASIVSGSQAHHPQGFVLGDDHFIHYGLGNLFFDQWFFAQVNPEIHKNKDKAFIDIHYFYNNRYINTILIPLQFIDNARPRPMTTDEKVDFLDTVFYASKWDDNWIYLYPVGFYDPAVKP
jgi:poly-gamma-glutamate synthesis protein (capsule biosynthesis protein)